MFDTFKERTYLGIVHIVDNMKYVAGHKRLFGVNGARGWHFYYYSEQAPGWALHRRWNFGLFCIHHVGEGKATDENGWHVTFASMRFKKEFHGFSFRWQLADTFRTKRGA